VSRGGEYFEDVTMAGGFGHLQKGHAVAFADFDNDGDVDVFEQMGGAYPGDRYGDALFENPGFGTRWIAIRLRGTSSNRAGIGARIRVIVNDGGNERSIYRTVSGGGSFGANPLRPTIGVGHASEIASIEIHWPVTGRTQIVRAVPLDAVIRITEGADGFERIELPAVRLQRQATASD
jgi:hypothetical protein